MASPGGRLAMIPSGRAMYLDEVREAPEVIQTQRDLDDMRQRWQSGQQPLFVQPAGHQPSPEAPREAHPWEELVEEAEDRLHDLRVRRAMFACVAIGYVCLMLLPAVVRYWFPQMEDNVDAEMENLGESEQNLTAASNGTTGPKPVTCTDVAVFPVLNVVLALLMLLATQVLFVWDWTQPEYPLFMDRRDSTFTVADPAKGDRHLAIATMDMGPAKEAWWNSFPDTEIDSDDHILEVNGIRGSAKDMVMEIRRTKNLAMKIGCRGPFSAIAMLFFCVLAALLGGITALSVGFGLWGVILVMVLCAAAGFLASNHQSPAWMSGHNDAAFRPGLCGGLCEPLLAIIGIWLFVTAVTMTIFRQFWPLFAVPLKAWPSPAGGYMLSPEGTNFSNFNFTASNCHVFSDCEAVGRAADREFGALGLAGFCIGALFMAVGQVMKKKHCESFLLEERVDLDGLTFQTSAAHGSPLVSKLRSVVKTAKRGGQESEELLPMSDASEKVMWSIEQSRSERFIHQGEFLRSLWPFALQAFGFALWAPLGGLHLDGCLSVDSGVQRTLLGVLLNYAGDLQDPLKLVVAVQVIGLVLAVAMLALAGVVVPLLRRARPDAADRLPTLLLPLLFLFSVSVVSLPIGELWPLAQGTRIAPDWKPNHAEECANLLSGVTWGFWSPQWLACIDWAWVAMMSRVALFAFYLMEVMHRSFSISHKHDVSPQEEGRALKQLQAVADSILDPLVVRDGRSQEAAARFALEVEKRIGAYARPSYRFSDD